MSSSVSNISFRYHPEDEQLEENYETSASISTTSIKSDSASEESSSSTEVPSTVLGRLGIREETDKWKLFREVKGRITKSVEDKLEEIKTERLKNQCNKRRAILGQMENSSISDSEEQSETSQPSASDKSTKSAPETLVHVMKTDKTDDKPESDASGSQESTPERSTTPVPTPADIVDDEVDLFFKKGKALKGALKKKKGKTKNESKVPVDKTTIAYSALCDIDTDSEAVELAQEVRELTAPEASETKLAKELERLAHPSLLKRLQRFVCDWHMFVLPLVAFLIHRLVQLPEYVLGFMVGVIGLLLLQKFADLVRFLLGSSEPPIKKLKDLLPLTEVPIFRRSVYDSDVADTQFEGWMNEYSREYNPETYHITLTDTVYVRLEGSKLRLSSPRSKVPKRALWNEPHYKLLFNRERLYDIANCQVVLRPEGLIHRRIWSKKYPICITLGATSKLGIKYREKSQETVDEDAPWIPEEKYNFDTLSEDSDEESTAPVNAGLSKENMDVGTASSRQSMDETISMDSIHSADSESIINLLPVEDLDDDFVKVIPVSEPETLLYLFARTDREKEIWFRRLTKAASKRGSPKSPKGSPKSKAPELDYLTFMLQLSQRTTAQLPLTRENNPKAHMNTADLSISLDMMWLNAFCGRLLYDVFQDPDKLVKIQEKIQRKLSAIKLPLFLEQLEVSQLDLGQTVPIVQRATRPTLNAQGVWVDLDIVYEGGFKMTIDTKLNLNRIKQMQPESPNSESPKKGSPVKAPTPTPQAESSRKSAVYDSEVEDSAETSSEEPDMSRLQDPSSAGPVVQHKYLRILDKVAQSKYFQQVVDYKFIKKFVAGNNLQLIVEVKGLLGTLVLNIPPPPSNRLWYGFRTNPKLWLSAQPKFGQHALHVISRIIEKKLSLEFQRILVLPNMDDLLVPIMNYDIPS